MKQFYECNLFGSDIGNLESFSFSQNRILFEDFLPNNQIKFAPVETKYNVLFEKSSDFSSDKVPLILPIRNMKGLLKYTVDNLLKFKANSICNIIIVDDRSTDNIKSIANKNNLSYIRVDYDDGFNYSMLANISSFICHKLSFSHIIFWNSDMWLPNENTLGQLIQKHRTNNPVISGTKLLYPLVTWDNKDIRQTENHKMLSKVLRDEDLDLRGKIQFGGSVVVPIGNKINTHHSRRGFPDDDFYVNVDKGTEIVTGAYSMIDLEWLISAGGFNPSLSKVYNDSDICLRAAEAGKGVHYYGKDTFLYHQESTNLNSSDERKFDHQYTSDQVLFSKIWNTQRYLKIISV